MKYFHSGIFTPPDLEERLALAELCRTPDYTDCLDLINQLSTFAYEAHEDPAIKAINAQRFESYNLKKDPHHAIDRDYSRDMKPVVAIAEILVGGITARAQEAGISDKTARRFALGITGFNE